jgi:hypothetical protein
LSEQLDDTEVDSKKDLRNLEVALQLLWEKARLVSENLLQLKQENRQLKEKLGEFERSRGTREAELETRERTIQDLRATIANLQANGTGAFNREERESMQEKIKGLIEKLNGRL